MGAQSPTTSTSFIGSPSALLAIGTTANCLVTLPTYGIVTLVHMSKDLSDTATPASSAAGDYVSFMDNSVFVATNYSHGLNVGNSAGSTAGRRGILFPGATFDLNCQLLTPSSSGSPILNIRGMGAGGVLMQIQASNNG